MTTCSIDACNGRVVGHGWCGKHLKRWQRHGDPLTVLPNPAATFHRPYELVAPPSPSAFAGAHTTSMEEILERRREVLAREAAREKAHESPEICL